MSAKIKDKSLKKFILWMLAYTLAIGTTAFLVGYGLGKARCELKDDGPAPTVTKKLYGKL